MRDKIRYTQTTPINESTIANNEIIAAQGAGIRIAILAIFMKSAGATNVTMKSGATTLSGPIPETAFSGEVISHGADSAILCPANTAFSLDQDGAVQLSGYVTWGKYVD